MQAECILGMREEEMYIYIERNTEKLTFQEKELLAKVHLQGMQEMPVLLHMGKNWWKGGKQN